VIFATNPSTTPANVGCNVLAVARPVVNGEREREIVARAADEKFGARRGSGGAELNHEGVGLGRASPNLGAGNVEVSGTVAADAEPDPGRRRQGVA